MKDRQYKGVRYSTVIIKSNDKFVLAGAVPQCFSNKIYETEGDAINDLLNIGLTKFQKSDCSWSDKNGKTIYDL